MNKSTRLLAVALLLGCSSAFAEDRNVSLVVELADGSTCEFDYSDVLGYSVSGRSLHIDTSAVVAGPSSFEISDIGKLYYLSPDGVDCLPEIDIHFKIQNGSLIIGGVAPGTECLITGSDGVVIAAVCSDADGCVSLQNLDAGIYCVRIGGNSSFKIKLI